MRRKEGWLKVFLRHENPNIVMLQKTKREVCDRWFVGSVWTIRNEAWASFPVCGALGGVIVVKGALGLRAARCHPSAPRLKAGDAPSRRRCLGTQGAT